MLLRFCNLCSKAAEPRVIKLQRHYKAASRVWRENSRILPDEEPEQKIEKRPIIVCKRKDFNFYEGQVYSKRGDIPIASKGWKHTEARGDYFFIHPVHNKEQDTCKESDKFTSFSDFNLNPQFIDKLTDLDIMEPLEIQREGIPAIMNGCNTILAAETGCGKTYTYLLPMINQVVYWKNLRKRSFNCPLGLIITPTRELAVQIGLETMKLSRQFGIRTKILVGGKTKRLMRSIPLSDVDITVASFGVISKLTTNRLYDLSFVRHIVLDEADALFHETFSEKVNVFMNRVQVGYVQDVDESGFPKTAQLTLACATIPTQLTEALRGIVNVDSLQHIATSKLHRILVTQKFMRMSPGQKPAELLKYIKPKVANKQPVIIFSNENSTCDWVSMFLNECGINAVNLNGTMPLFHRKGKYAQFRNGRSTVLSTTNAGSRGLDTVMVNHVLNYEFPLDTSDYIHRCGRTGRVGTKGKCQVTNFISTPLEIRLTQIIERATRKMKPMPMVNLLRQKTLPEEEEEAYVEPDVEHIIESMEEEDSIPY